MSEKELVYLIGFIAVSSFKYIIAPVLAAVLSALIIRSFSTRKRNKKN